MPENLTCIGGKQITKMKINDYCPNTTNQVITISTIITIFSLTTGIFIFIYNRFNHEIKVWLYEMGFLSWWVAEEELDSNKLYDAFISYSHKDEEFIINDLVPGLENGTPKFKLCLHNRDWIVGDYIPDQIVRSVRNSRRTIVVLSPNFLDSDWGIMEFQTAHAQAKRERRTRVIVIILGDIGHINNLDSELKAYITTNTYIMCSDPRFWSRLRYALPHPSKVRKTSLSLTGIQQSFEMGLTQ